MLPRNHPDRIQIAFDDPRLVANAWAAPPGDPSPAPGPCVKSSIATSTWETRRGRANPGDKLLTLVASALAGGDFIDDARRVAYRRDSWRHRGCVVKAPSTLGTFLRSFRWGHVRQLDRVSRELLSQGLGRWDRTRRRAVDHRPGLHHVRDLRDWPRRGRVTMVTLASGAITRCWPSPPAPERC